MNATNETMLFRPSWLSVESWGLLLLVICELLHAVMGVFLKLCSSSGIPSTELVLVRSLVETVFILTFLCTTKPKSVAHGGAHYEYVSNHNAQLRRQAEGDGETGMPESMESSTTTALLPQRPLLFTPFGGTRKVQKIVVIRGIVGGITFIMYFATLKLLPLGDAITLLSLSPTFTIFLAAMFLGEPIFPSHCVATVVSLAGAICIARPSIIFGVDEGNSWIADSPYYWVGYITAILGSICGAGAMALMRGAGTMGVHTLQLVWSFLVFSFIIAIVFGHMEWVERIDGVWSMHRDPKILMYLAAMGLTGTAGHVMLNFAARLAPAGMGSIVRSSNIVWAYVFEVVVFQQVPQSTTWVGVLLIFVSLAIIAFQKWRDDREVAAVDEGYRLLTDGGSDDDGAGADETRRRGENEAAPSMIQETENGGIS
uniref:EamA domain-containing protein n=1 Tax=Craspedostauros australis TaxID=1486917 RepID=A0A7R9WPD1_9STRA|mmetsp:Transcript_14668/g.40518  ORF Transcript_14668/g.40518 Transcript_14668/m.40518 type:complete len:427 (+) Transcript_14668:220-1500(+)